MAVRQVEPIDRAELRATIQKWIDAHTDVDDTDGVGLLEDALWEINAQPTLTPPNEWISVEEKLPESIVNKVLVYCENGYIGYGHYEKYQGEETWYNLESGEPFSSWNWQNCSPYKVTHWMPLPEAPDSRLPEGET